MSVRARYVLILASLTIAGALSQGAFAGTEAKPEIKDAEGDPAFPTGAFYGDILEAWIDKETDASFNVNIKYKTLDAAAARQSSYRFDFVYRGYGYNLFAFIGADGSPGFATNRYNKDTFENFEGNDTKGEFRFGSPGYLSMTFPKRFLEENLTLTPSTLGNLTLSGLAAYSWEIKAGGCLVIGCANDVARSNATYALRPPPTATAPEEPVETGNVTGGGVGSSDQGASGGDPISTDSSDASDRPSGGIAPEAKTPLSPVLVPVAITLGALAVRRRR
jgi:hypothetical protein